MGETISGSPGDHTGRTREVDCNETGPLVCDHHGLQIRVRSRLFPRSRDTPSAIGAAAGSLYISTELLSTPSYWRAPIASERDPERLMGSVAT